MNNKILNNKILNRFSLGKKFGLSLAIYSFMLLTLTLSVIYYFSLKTANRDLAKKASMMIELAAFASIDPLWNFNNTAVAANGEALLKDEDVCRVVITDSEGKIIYQKSKQSQLTSKRYLIELTRDVEQNGQKIGRIRLGITRYLRLRALMGSLISNIIMSTLLAVILGIGNTLFNTAGIARPINQMVSGLTQQADQMAAASNQLAAASQELSEGSAEQASSIEETSSTLHETASTLEQNNTNVKQAAQLSEQTKAAADKGNQGMQVMMNAIDDIKKSSDQIAKIIKIIDDIAFQTNILALNAAIEAARAGEAGLGFAVVAEEVRNLAQRSAQAAKETAAMIESNLDLSANGVTTANRVKKDLDEITTQAKKVSELMEEIAAATEEQAKGIEQINATISQMSSITERNATSAEESAAASRNLNDQAMNLREIIRQLSELVNGEDAGANAGETGQNAPPAMSTEERQGNPDVRARAAAVEDVIPLGEDNRF